MTDELVSLPGAATLPADSVNMGAGAGSVTYGKLVDGRAGGTHRSQIDSSGRLWTGVPALAVGQVNTTAVQASYADKDCYGDPIFASDPGAVGIGLYAIGGIAINDAHGDALPLLDVVVSSSPGDTLLAYADGDAFPDDMGPAAAGFTRRVAAAGFAAVYGFGDHTRMWIPATPIILPVLGRVQILLVAAEAIGAPPNAAGLAVDMYGSLLGALDG